MQKLTILLACLTWLTFGGCKSDKDADTATEGVSPQCDAPDGYVAFDVGNHHNQDVRLNTYDEMLELMESAVDEDGNVDGDKFVQAKALYMDETASANLRAKVQERKDEHLDGGPLQGDRIDATIVAFLDFGAEASTALEAHVAAEWVDKSLQEWFFLSVYYELVEPTRQHWDEAFGYFGSHSDNDDAKLQGLALSAFKRDATNGTNLEPEIFNALIDGACILDEALTAADAEELALEDIDGLPAVVEEIDGNLQKVLAFYAGHEAYEMQELLDDGADTDEVVVKTAELVPIMLPLLRIMEERGGDSADRAEQLKTLLADFPLRDGVPDSDALTDTSFIDSLDLAQLLSILEAEYDIEIKG